MDKIIMWSSNFTFSKKLVENTIYLYKLIGAKSFTICYRLYIIFRNNN